MSKVTEERTPTRISFVVSKIQLGFPMYPNLRHFLYMYGA